MKTIPVREIKPAPAEPALSQTFRIRDLETLLGGKDMSEDTHRHNFFYILLVKSGKGNHEIDFTPYKIDDYCIFILRPGQVHQLELRAGATGYLMTFNMEFYHLNDRGSGQVLRKATANSFCQVAESTFTRLHSIAEHMHREYQDAKEGYNEIIRAQLDIFFIEFIRNRQESRTSTTKASPYEQERLEEFLALVETHVSSRKPISDYANMLNLSGYQLSALTKSALGKTPSEIVNEYIILESKRYLMATSDQVNQIAWHLGFEDPSYFIRFFKKHTGYSPDVFRTNSI